jgi:hypothetical protein
VKRPYDMTNAELVAVSAEVRGALADLDYEWIRRQRLRWLQYKTVGKQLPEDSEDFDGSRYH